MLLDEQQIQDANKKNIDHHRTQFSYLSSELTQKGHDVEQLLEKLAAFQIAIPSWALGVGGTRFGRFSMGGEPRSLEEKMDDVGLLHQLNQSSGAISLHIPWDIPEDVDAIKQRAQKLDIKFDAVNSNTFQDQEGQEHSYKFSSLAHTHQEVR